MSIFNDRTFSCQKNLKKGVVKSICDGLLSYDIEIEVPLTFDVALKEENYNVLRQDDTVIKTDQVFILLRKRKKKIRLLDVKSS